MSPDDVYGDEMDGPHDFDDETADALLGGAGRDVDPDLADLLGDVRVAYTSTPPAVGATLAALIGPPEPALTPVGRLERMRASMMAKIGVATAAVVAATGGLAVAGALPTPVQDAMSHIGVTSDDNPQDSPGGVVDDETTTTTVAGETTTTVEDNNDNDAQNEDGENEDGEHEDNHGDDVSDVAHDHSGEGCEHGAAVSAVASDGRSHNDCGTPEDPTTPTTVDKHGHGGDDNDGQDEGDDHGHDGGTTPTTAGITPTTVDDHGHDGQGGDNNNGGGEHGSEHSGSSGHGGGDD